VLGNSSPSHWIRACSGPLGSFDWSQLVNLIDHIWSSEGTDGVEGRSSLNSSTRLSTRWRHEYSSSLMGQDKAYKPIVAFLACSLNLLVRSEIVMVWQWYSSGVAALMFSMRGTMGILVPASSAISRACFIHPPWNSPAPPR